MDYKFNRKRIDKIPESKILDELEQAAEHFNYIEFGWRDFDKIADISAGTVENHFGNWKKGLQALKKRLQQKGMDLSSRPYSPNARIGNCSFKLRMLIVCYCYRENDTVLRILSARKATNKERLNYER